MTKKENFAELLQESLGSQKSFRGSVMKGTIMALDKDMAIVDVGLKSEGRIPLREFGYKMASELRVGDQIDVYIESMENRHGEAVLSYEKARRESLWEELEAAHRKNERVTGSITSRVKGGFTVDLSGVVAFLPGSQVDVRPIKDPNSLVGIEQPFQILKMDRLRGNVVVSRRAVMEESRAEARSEVMANLAEGKVISGIVKNITEYGAFVDLGGVDGLLHVTDISWNRVNHPSEVLQVGQQIEVQIIKISAENQRISLGMKHLEKDPWESVENQFQAGTIIQGQISNITDYGVFVELGSGVEGLIHSSELSWTKKNVHPNKVVNVGDKVSVKVLDIDLAKRRISLSLKQANENPWDIFGRSHKIGDIIEGEIKNIAEFGLFIGLEGNIDGMIHVSDIAWGQNSEKAAEDYKKGQMVQAKIMDIDLEKERISLSIKHLSEDTFETNTKSLRSGEVVTCTVKTITTGGIEVETDKGLIGFIRKGDLSRDRSEQRTDRFAVGELVDAQVLSVDPKTRKLALSIKARELHEEKKVMEQYGSSDSGASLGEILGGALGNMKKVASEAKAKAPAKKKADADETGEEVAEAPAKKTKAAAKEKAEPKTKKTKETVA